MSAALPWYVGFWLAHGADAGPWLAGLCVVLGVGFLLLGLALRVLTRVLVYSGLAVGGAWLLARLKWRKKRDFYSTYLGTAAWKARARAARLRAGNRCARCQRAGPLDVHHLHYRNLGHEPPEDLVAVCHACHWALHGKVARNPLQKYVPRKRGRKR